MNLRTFLIFCNLLAAVVTLTTGVTASPALAQGAGTLSGSIVDSSGLPAPGVLVELTGSGLRLARRSDQRGLFTFAAIPLGTYALRAEARAGSAYSTLELTGEGAFVVLHLLKTVGETSSVASAPIHGSGTDVVLNQNAISRSPGAGSLPDILMQLPGAARGANGVVHINGDHGDINYIVDGTPVPQALNREIGTEIDPSQIAFMEALEGAYAAEYGGRFATVLNIVTKTSQGAPGFSGYMTAGSFASYDSNLEYHTAAGKGSIQIASRLDRSGRALDPPNFPSVHDDGSHAGQFVRYAVPFGNDFLLASAMHSLQTFQIPDGVSGGQAQSTDDGEVQDDFLLNVRYHHTLRTNGSLDFGLAFKRSRIRDSNDLSNDFAYGQAANSASGGAPGDCASGVVTACAYSLFSDRTARDVILTVDGGAASGRHNIRYGAGYDAANVQKLYTITLQPNNFLSPGPATIVDSAPNVAHTESAFVQDSWMMGRLWRADYGLRADAFQLSSTDFARGFAQISPRLKITRVYGNRSAVYVYAGRFFTPFSLENVSPASAHQLNAPVQADIAPFDLKPQRDTDLEAGTTMPLGPGQIGLRVMQKTSVDLIDDTQVGLTALHQDINYARGNISSQSVDYQQLLARGGRAYASLTHTRSVNKGCETQLLAPCFGASQDWMDADHDQRWDGAAGATVPDRRGGWWSIDGEYGSGLSSSYCKPASGECKVPPHLTFDIERGISVSPRLTITLGAYNVLNDRYRITYYNAQGNHYSAGRTFRLGLRFGGSTVRQAHCKLSSP